MMSCGSSQAGKCFQVCVFDIFPCPSRVPLLYLQTVVGDVVRTLKVMYGSLDRFVLYSHSC